MWNYRWVLTFVAVAAAAGLASMFTEGLLRLFFLAVLAVFAGCGVTMIPTASRATRPQGPTRGGLVE